MVGPLGLSIPGCRKVVQLDLKENSMQNAGLLQHEYGIVSWLMDSVFSVLVAYNIMVNFILNTII